jgi:hypothetical protein
MTSVVINEGTVALDRALGKQWKRDQTWPARGFSSAQFEVKL